LTIRSGYMKASLLGLFLIPAFLCADYREKNAGDEAFRQNDYFTAASFYQGYLERAREVKDIAGEKDAYERWIDSLVLGKSPEQAKKILKEYQQAFPGADPVAVTMWTADILLMQNQPDAARKHIERILGALTVDNPRRVHALFSLARAYERLGNLAKAADLYFTIGKETSTGFFGQKNKATKLQVVAWERGIYCQIFTSQTKKVAEALLNHPEVKNPDAQKRIQMLNTLFQIKTGPVKNIPGVWAKYKVLDDYSGNDLSYPALSMIGDTAAKAGYPNVAAEAYSAAYNCAPDKNELFKTLNRLLLVIHSAGNKKASADLALKTMSLFKGDFISVKFLEEVSDILMSAEKYSDASRTYTELVENSAVTEKSKHHAMRCLSRISAKIKLPEKTLKLMDAYFSGAKGGERYYLYAETLLGDKKYSDAAKNFQMVAKQYPAWRRKALYQAAYCLLTVKDYKQALSILEQFFREKGDDKMYTDAVYMNAIAMEASGNNAAWKEYVRYSVRNDREANYTQEALLRGGRLAFVSGDAMKALELLERLIREFPRSTQSIEAANWRIYIYRTLNNDYYAERATHDLEYAWPDSQVTFDAMYRLAEQNFSTDSYEKVMGIFNELRRKSALADNRARVLVGQASLAVYHKKYAEALDFLNQLDRNYPGSRYRAKAAYLRGHIVQSSGDYRKAVDFYEKVLSLNPDSYLYNAANGSIGDCNFVLAGKSQNMDLYKKALESYELILKQKDLAAGLYAMTLYKAGRTMELMGKDDDALKYYKMALYLPAAFDTPASRLWATKAAEAIYSIAEKHPIKQKIEDASSALNVLEKFQIIPEGTAARRTGILNRARFRPKAK